MARKAYPYVIGAYSTSPQLRRADDGRWCAQSEIQQWTGSLADVCAATEIVLQGEGKRCAPISVALNSGISQRFKSPYELRGALEQLDPYDIATVRVDADIPDDGHAVIVVRRQKPGVVVTVDGRDRAHVVGLAHLVHVD